MKYSVSAMFCLISSVLIVSCSGSRSYDDVNASDIKEACDCMEAFDVITSDMLNVLSEINSKEEYNNSPNIKAEGDKITAKYNEIDDRCDELKFSRKDLKGCDKNKKVTDQMKLINEKINL
jgi:hypothetical protein